MIPSRDGGNRMTKINEMRRRLHEDYQWAVDRVQHMTPEEVEEAYDAASYFRASQQHLLGNVKYPLHGASQLDKPTEWTRLATIKFRDGGSFIQTDVLQEHLEKTLTLVASYVTYDSKERKRTTWKREPTMY